MRPRKTQTFVEVDAAIQRDTFNDALVRMIGAQHETERLLLIARDVLDRIVALEARQQQLALGRPEGSA